MRVVRSPPDYGQLRKKSTKRLWLTWDATPSIAFNKPERVTVEAASPYFPGSPSGDLALSESSSSDSESSAFRCDRVRLGITQSLHRQQLSMGAERTCMSSIKIRFPGGQDRKDLLSFPSSILFTHKQKRRIQQVSYPRAAGLMQYRSSLSRLAIPVATISSIS
jgi:hypothetical protein